MATEQVRRHRFAVVKPAEDVLRARFRGYVYPEKVSVNVPIDLAGCCPTGRT